MKVKIKFEKSFDIPVISFRIKGGGRGLCILDTGSEATLFDKSFVHDNGSLFQIDETRHKLNLIGLSSNNDIPVVMLKTEVLFGRTRNKTFNINNAYIADLSNISSIPDDEKHSKKIDALIGSDVLSELHAKINYEKREVIFEDDISC